MGLPPAGGCVTSSNIIKPTAIPTAKGIDKYKGKGIKFTNSATKAKNQNKAQEKLVGFVFYAK